MHTTNYINTFIEVAEDCPLSKAEIPPEKNSEKSIAKLQYEMIVSYPYKYTSDDVIFKIYAIRNNIKEEEVYTEREKFFSKGQPCFRSSPLPKRYGWGIHSDDQGKIALYAVESEEYKKLSRDINLKQIKAMRSKRK